MSTNYFRTAETQNKLFEALKISVNDEQRAVINPNNEKCEIVVFDTETTGLSCTKDYIVQLSGQKYKVENNKFALIDEFNSYLNWGAVVQIDGTKAGEVNGITDKMLSEAPDAREVMENWINFTNGIDIFVGYNSNFDIRFINEAYQKLDLGMFVPKIHLDVLIMVKDVVDAPHYKLIDMAQHFGVDEDIDFHNSLADVEATERLLECCIDEYAMKISLSKPATSAVKPKIKRLSFWEGYRGMKRIYIETDIGTFYYDILQKRFAIKPGSTNLRLNDIDMEYFRLLVMEKAGVGSETELAHYR